MIFNLIPIVPNSDGLIIRARDNQRLPVANVQTSQTSAVERVQKYGEHILFNLQKVKMLISMIKDLNYPHLTTLFFLELI